MGCTQVGGSDVLKPSGQQQQKSKNTFESRVIVSKPQEMEFRAQIMNKIIATKGKDLQNFTLVYRGSENGFSSAAFHKFTDGLPNTVTILKTKKGVVFGGYTPCAWEKEVMYKYATDQNRQSFLFRLPFTQNEGDEEQILDLQIFSLTDGTKAIMNHETNGPVFGEGHDLVIGDDCNLKESWSNLGKSYACSFKFGSNKANEALTGSSKFLIQQYQVWSLEF